MSAPHSIPQSILLPMIGFGLVSMAQAATLTRMAVEPNTKFELTRLELDTALRTARDKINEG